MKGIQEQNQTEAITITAGVKSNRKRKQPKEIKIVRMNEPPIGLLEKTLAEIYAKKVKNGTLIID